MNSAEATALLDWKSWGPPGHMAVTVMGLHKTQQMQGQVDKALALHSFSIQLKGF